MALCVGLAAPTRAALVVYDSVETGRATSAGTSNAPSVRMAADSQSTAIDWFADASDIVSSNPTGVGWMLDTLDGSDTLTGSNMSWLNAGNSATISLRDMDGGATGSAAGSQGFVSGVGAEKDSVPNLVVEMHSASVCRL